MRVVVSCDTGSGSEGGGEDERVEFSIPPSDLLRLLLFFCDRRVSSEESENLEFCFNVRAEHDGDGRGKREGETEGEHGEGNEKNETKLVVLVVRRGCHRSG